MIALVVPDLTYSMFAEIAKAVVATVRPLGYEVVICDSNEDPLLEADAIEHLLARQVDGLILASAQPRGSGSVFERMEVRKLPCVLIGRPVSEAS